MSNNLTITAAVWAHRVDGVPLVAGIVEGVLVHPESPSFGPRGALPEFDEPEMRPPADLVALRDARCETCAHAYIKGTLLDFDTKKIRGRKPCPDCVDGRPLVDVRVELPDDMAKNEPHHNCPECGGFSTLYEAMWSKPCPKCSGTGTVTVKGLIDVAPVCDARTCDAAVQDNYPHHVCVFTSGRVARIWGHTEYVDLTPGHVEALGTIQPGQWAWIFTEVEA